MSKGNYGFTIPGTALLARVQAAGAEGRPPATRSGAVLKGRGRLSFCRLTPRRGREYNCRTLEHDVFAETLRTEISGGPYGYW